MPLELEDLEQKNRNFICSCQKAYLSYAALFTHIKQKHGGKAPGQIVRPRSLNKRGRPRKNDKVGSQKVLRSESSDGYLGYNNLKNINFANESQSDDDIQQPLNTKGFTSYKNSTRLHRHNSTPLNSQNPLVQYASFEHQPMQMLKQDDEEEEESMEFVNPNNELSSNTLALASIIIGLQQFFKDANNLEFVRDYQLQAFSSYIDLKEFHSKKLLQKNEQKPEEEVFLLGNMVCAFLNFCHQTLEGKAAYQQIVLLMVCLLQHIKGRKTRNVLISCRKEVIHECLPSFFQQYLDRVIIKSKLNFWIFKQNNSFKVLIWFLNWLSAIEANYLKNITPQKSIRGDSEVEENHQAEKGVEFQNPTFLKQILQEEKLEAENKTLSSIQKKEFENILQAKDGSDLSESVKSVEQQEKIRVSGVESEHGLPEAQINEADSDNDNNELIGIERLSSEVR